MNFVKLLKGYPQGWVAISEDFSKVILAGKTLREVREKAKDMNEKLYFFPSGESYGNFVGTEV